ncbi:hypothetical protein AX17_001739 [Amanita inopinata Kibby_2008]|nr:hypothetical protein AX17_001739 [Amanita inopinata Kibby_2008]
MGKHQGQARKRQKVDELPATPNPTISSQPTKAPLRSILKKPGQKFQNAKVEESGSEAEERRPRNKGKSKEQSLPTPKLQKSTIKKRRAIGGGEERLPTSFKIVAGTYEKLLYGLDARVTVSTPSPNESSSSTEPMLSFTLHPIFAFPAHVSCIKAVATSPHGGKWLATGSADEIIKIWDLRRRKEIGGLMHHQGSITHLLFPSRSHLLSASEDGTLCLFHARDWTVLRVMKGHKTRVNAVAVHPSGKVALSVGKDRTLRMWDLMRGKGCASTKLGKEGEIVRWSTDGSKFVVQSGSTMDIYDTEMNLLHTITHPSRLHDVKFCQRVSGPGEVLLAGAEDGKLSVYEISSTPERPPRIIAQLVGHERRVKALQTVAIKLPSSYPTRKTTIVACTASSDGKLCLYDLALLPEHNTAMESDEPLEIEPAAVYDTKGTRLTCLTVADGDVDDGQSGNTGKRKHDDDDVTMVDDSGGEGESGDEEPEWEGVQESEEEEEEESE